MEDPRAKCEEKVISRLSKTPSKCYKLKRKKKPNFNRQRNWSRNRSIMMLVNWRWNRWCRRAKHQEVRQLNVDYLLIDRSLLSETEMQEAVQIWTTLTQTMMMSLVLQKRLVKSIIQRRVHLKKNSSARLDRPNSSWQPTNRKSRWQASFSKAWERVLINLFDR